MRKKVSRHAAHFRQLVAMVRCDSQVSIALLCLFFMLHGMYPSSGRADDIVELLSGAKVNGKVTKIDKVARVVTFDAAIGSRKYSRSYPYSKIHAVTLNGKRYTLNERTTSTDASPPRRRPGRPAESGSADTGARVGRRTASQVEALIDEMGRTPPDWYADTRGDYPDTLDMSWPKTPPKGWNAQRNVGQYIWDIINPNPNRWREGVRLMHDLLVRHKDNPEVRMRAMNSLAGMYFRFFQDYARAAFWWQQVGVGPGQPQAIRLAECYWRLDCRQKAVQLLNQRTLYVGMIKLWGEMGELQNALKVAETYVRVGGAPHAAYLAAGDACRLAGEFKTSMGYYQKVISTPPRRGREKQDNRIKERARANLEAIRLFELLDVRKVPDGTYSAAGPGYAGPVHVEVTVRAGRLEEVRVTRHQEKQFYSSVTDTPRQIVEKQGVKGVDAFSGATITSEAIINATAKALAGAAGNSK